jgi:mono/diheme cytochrome c family protein
MKKKLRKSLLPLLLFLLLLQGCKPAPQSHTQLPPAGSLPKGQELFLSHCASCHQGVGNPPAPNAVILDSETLKSQTSFTALLRNPRAATMTQFTPDLLSDQDAQQIYNYILSVKNP